MIYTKEEWAAELEVRKEWDWTLSDMELSRRHPYVFRESIQRLRHQLGHPTVRKTKKPKVYSDHAHCSGLTLKWVNESERHLGAWLPRFWSKVKKNGAGDCWNWTGMVQNSGYGLLMIGIWKITRRWHLAHRLAYVLHYGEIPKGKIVRHKCDNKLCVNWRHLELGTTFDNVMDAVRRQGMNCGIKNGNSLLRKAL